MTLSTSGLTAPNASSPVGGSSRTLAAERAGKDAMPGAAPGRPPVQPEYLGMLIQSMSGTGLTGTGAVSGGKAGDIQQALAGFVQNLLAAIGNSAGDRPPPPPGEAGPSLTQADLAASLAELQASDGNRYMRNQALLDNFDSADANGDGAISRDEAHAFNEANNIPTTSGDGRPPAGGIGYAQPFADQLAANLQNLIRQLTASPATGAPAPGSASTGLPRSAEDLQSSHENLLGALGAASQSGSLVRFLETLKTSLASRGANGNFVDVTA